jgi:hypothetical protein
MFLKYCFYTILQLIAIANCVKAIADNYQCGVKRSNIVNYIYGGRQSTIENWPWQVHILLPYLKKNKN